MVLALADATPSLPPGFETTELEAALQENNLRAMSASHESIAGAMDLLPLVHDGVLHEVRPQEDQLRSYQLPSKSKDPES
jgi:hypothetical protein